MLYVVRDGVGTKIHAGRERDPKLNFKREWYGSGITCDICGMGAGFPMEMGAGAVWERDQYMRDGTVMGSKVSPAQGSTV